VADRGGDARRCKSGVGDQGFNSPAGSVIEIHLDGRLVLTTAQAAARLGVKPGSLRARITREGIRPAAQLDPRTPLYYPEDLGLESA
jgi:hypothetical protein